MMDYTKYKGRDLTLWEKFFPPSDYDCGCRDFDCVCGWWPKLIGILFFFLFLVTILAAFK